MGAAAGCGLAGAAVVKQALACRNADAGSAARRAWRAATAASRAEAQWFPPGGEETRAERIQLQGGSRVKREIEKPARQRSTGSGATRASRHRAGEEPPSSLRQSTSAWSLVWALDALLPPRQRQGFQGLLSSHPSAVSLIPRLCQRRHSRSAKGGCVSRRRQQKLVRCPAQLTAKQTTPAAKSCCSRRGILLQTTIVPRVAPDNRPHFTLDPD